MLKKIISDGQTGADRAALDAAIQLGIPHGGWVPTGRMAEDGIIPPVYHLVEITSSNYPERTAKNIRKSDGTLIMNHGRLTGDARFAREQALKYNRPCLHIDLSVTPVPKALPTIVDWIIRNRIEVLNVTGAKASRDADIYAKTYHILCSVIALCQYEPEKIETGRRNAGINPDQSHRQLPPLDVDDAVDRLINALPLRDRALIANMSDDELIPHYFTLGNYIRNHFGLWSGNQDLLDACRCAAHDQYLHPDAAAELIIKTLWRTLQDTHKLRLIK